MNQIDRGGCKWKFLYIHYREITEKLIPGCFDLVRQTLGVVGITWCEIEVERPGQTLIK